MFCEPWSKTLPPKFAAHQVRMPHVPPLATNERPLLIWDGTACLPTTLPSSRRAALERVLKRAGAPASSGTLGFSQPALWAVVGAVLVPDDAMRRGIQPIRLPA